MKDPYRNDQDSKDARKLTGFILFGIAVIIIVALSSCSTAMYQSKPKGYKCPAIRFLHEQKHYKPFKS